MENAALSSRPDARIIQLRPPEIHHPSFRLDSHLPTMMELHTLEYIDQLLDEHFK